jgi:hypothetical protein
MKDLHVIEIGTRREENGMEEDGIERDGKRRD